VTFDELQVFDGIARRTGNTVDRAALRGRSGVCRSMSELCARSRRLGDGFYYLASSAWPADAESVNVVRTWSSLS
jgi:hypothetical protein